MILNIVYLIAGLALILYGANILTDGSAAIARRLGISDLVVGLTVVAFGTSAPELVISLVSAINGSSAMAVGNIVGSNIFNVLMIIGITALVLPIKIEKGIMINEIPLVILSSLVLLVMGSAPLLDGTPDRILSRVDGIILLLFFTIFMRYTFSQAHNGSPSDPVAEDAASRPVMSMTKSVIYVVGGLAALIFGGDRFVAGASAVASSMGVSDAVIGLTIVAVGTSLPELATSVTAAIKGQTGIALGNVIGSNIFNIFMVLGLTSTIRPLAFGGITMTDLIVMTGAALLFWFFGWKFKERTITRVEGGVMVAAYVGYTAWLILNV